MGGLFRFPADESGAVVVDWTVLVAGVLLNGTMVVMAIFNGDISPLAHKVDAAVIGAHSAPSAAVVVASAPSGPGYFILAP